MRGKTKAVSHQNEIRDLLRHVFCPPFVDDDITSRPMGNKGSDIILSPQIKELFPFYIECKRHEDKTWAGSCKSSYEQVFCYDMPLLIRRKNRSQNHFYTRINDVLNIHPKFLVTEKDILLYAENNLRGFLKSNSFITSICGDTLHFNTQKFMEILSCLKASYFR